MKNIILMLVLTLGCLPMQAQFLHLKVNKESGPARITFMDDTVLSGTVKNNKAENFILRGLAVQNDGNAMSNANIVAEKIRFKEEGQSEFKELPASQIKKVTFLDKDGVSFMEVFRINVARLDLDNGQIKKMQTMFLPLLMAGNFKTYGYSVYDRGVYWYTYAFVAVKGEDYVVSLTQNTTFPSESKVFKVLKYVGKNCKAYQEYMEAVDAKGDLISRTEFKEALKNFKSLKGELIDQTKESKQMGKAEAKVHFQIMKDLYYIEFLEDKYVEWCK
ncbi:hypothetical protein [Flavobacterium sp. JP2137]|uniref:hypothetical protein n=1 Tax=Flavobacterium sp. JP2137 TaxID=3414510 RepID=UPI003D2FA3DB